MINVLNAGGWYVGNTAILDWMDGFDDLTVVKGDFNVTRYENGIMDIIAEKKIPKKIAMIRSQKLLCIKSIYYVSRIKIGDYTKRLLKPKTKHSYYAHYTFFKLYYEYLVKHEKSLLLKDYFDEVKLWKEFLYKQSFVACNKIKSKKNIIYQNPYFYSETFSKHEAIWPELFFPYKSIFIYRDPIDQFSDIVNNGAHLDTSWPRFHAGTENLDPAERFLTISKKIFKSRMEISKNLGKDELLIISFEDFLQKHEEVSKKLKDFLSIEGDRDNNNKRFSVNKSLKNIGKGKFNIKAMSILNSKEHILQELYTIHNTLKNHKNSI